MATLILDMIGPFGVLLLAFGSYRYDPRRISLSIAFWVGINFLFYAIRFMVHPGYGMTFAWLLPLIELMVTGSAFVSIRWLREHPSQSVVRYYFWWALFYAALVVIAITQNLVLAWLAIEFSTLVSSALLIEVGNRRALEAAFKYMVIASVGMSVALLGIVLLYASLQSQHLGWQTFTYANLALHHQAIAPIVRHIITIMMLCGIGTKAGLVPFHTWLPDAHSVAPSPISGLLSGCLLGLCLLVIDHFLRAISMPSTHFLSGQHLLLIFGVLSVLIGSFALFVQKDVKRMLAYSSIEQVGMMAIGFGIGTPLAIDAALLQFVFHAMIKASLFYLAGYFSERYHSTNLFEWKEITKKFPRLAILWAILLLALAGLPPLGLAYSEWMLILSLWDQQQTIVLLALCLGLVLSFSALSDHLIKSLWKAPRNQTIDLS